MPMYEWLCPHCNMLFQGIQKLKDFDKPVKCPKCGKELKRQMSPVMFKI